MRYLLALICPPLAIGFYLRPWQAASSLAIWILGLMTISWGIGIIPLVTTILWAVHAVGDDRAAQVTSRFVRTVKPIRTIRG